MKVSLTKVQTILPEFVEARLLPVAPPTMKFLIGGALPVVLAKTDEMVAQYLPTLKQFGLVDEQRRLDMEKASAFIRAGFEKSGSIPLFGFIFKPEDGEALIAIMEKYHD